MKVNDEIEGSGSISQRHGSADPDPDPPQNDMNPQHCFKDDIPAAVGPTKAPSAKEEVKMLETRE